MFPSFAPTSLPLSLDQIGNPDSSPFSYQFLIDPPSYQDSIHSDFSAHVSSSEHNPVFQEMTTTDAITYKYYSCLDSATHFSSSEQNSVFKETITSDTITNKDYSCLDFSAPFSSSEKNPGLQEMTTTDAITYKDYSCLDFADYFSIDEQNPVMEQTTTIGSSSKTSHNSINDSFLSQPNNFHIDEVMRERVHAGLKIALRMKTTLEVVDDGYKWRKYGKKKVKSNPYPRNYFKCSTVGCIVKKRLERDKDDSRYVITTYDGVHNHKGYFS